MKKHGILSVDEEQEFVAQQNRNRTQEDEWRRQAFALIDQHRQPWDHEGRNLPLRVMANHPSVAWHRTNETTGAPVRITRIGTKRGNGSSDW
mmetsp:Transcript_27807/g.67005  ORF Transcript_27807/g.67005 Transcript_27807/m.67005 type:complete len:92 (+) Transcript_27807:168-443(+)